ncbi:hypothetical protein [Pseudooctadecabacter sp.]|uniref:hypothetical protein n=1 Tax=Pseudooctadecabacter sp. TaxID=1966338 RepID=UPI0025E8BE22|nr:hypothetical protein [Pseudooctadecabacter sp.]
MTRPDADQTTPEVIVRPGKRVEFLDRASYRQRRMRDAARILPVFAAIMMVLPLMWPRGSEGQSLTSNGMLYLFGLWFVLVVLAFAVSRVLRTGAAEDGTGQVRE